MDPIAFSVGALVAGSLYVFAYRRKGAVATTRIGARAIELTSPGRPDDVFDTIAAIGAPYTVDDKDRERRLLVLSSRPSIWSYGFLYPIAVREDGAGSIVVIGVTSRLFHIGPGVGIAHERCARAIAELLTVPAARLT